MRQTFCWQNAKGHAIGDWDNDGNLDWFSTAMYQNRSECSMSGCMYVHSGNVLFRNQGGMQFEKATDQVICLPFVLSSSFVILFS